jgi:2,3-bisphosphoglycerate-dependent phosphoglycerate mutase
MRTLLFLLCLITGLTIGQNAAEKPTTLILIRHAEKGDDGSKDPPLSDAGATRANSLVSALKNTTIDAIYSSNYKRTKNTVAPVAQAKSLEVKIYEPLKEDEIKKILANHKGQTILIAGHSNSTPWTANFLTGSKLANFADTDYGNILIITFWDFDKASMNWLNY